MRGHPGKHLPHSPSYRQVAEWKATQRINEQLRIRLSKEEREGLWTRLDPATEQNAIDAEVKRQGEGSRLLIEFIRPFGTDPY